MVHCYNLNDAKQKDPTTPTTNQTALPDDSSNDDDLVIVDGTAGLLLPPSRALREEPQIVFHDAPADDATAEEALQHVIQSLPDAIQLVILQLTADLATNTREAEIKRKAHNNLKDYDTIPRSIRINCDLNFPAFLKGDPRTLANAARLQKAVTDYQIVAKGIFTDQSMVDVDHHTTKRLTSLLNSLWLLSTSLTIIMKPLFNKPRRHNDKCTDDPKYIGAFAVVKICLKSNSLEESAISAALRSFLGVDQNTIL